MSQLSVNIALEKISQDALLPTKAHESDAGFDLFSNEKTEIPPMGRHAVALGFKMEIPLNWEAQIRPRSGLAIKHGITVLNSPGTIDSGYRGEVKAILVNLSSSPFMIEKGMKVAQMLISPIHDVKLNWSSSLSSSVRGESGFGSTGY